MFFGRTVQAVQWKSVPSRKVPNAGHGRNQTVLMEGRTLLRPLILGTRPRRSVALQITRKHARTGAHMLRRKGLSYRLAAFQLSFTRQGG